tara:strand:- start:8082 stop:9047 length:966 start_codon:yes stop_codon:yes gene_type:complete
MISAKNIWSEIKNRLDLNVLNLVSSTMPISGADGDGAGFAGPGSTCTDNSTGIKYVNENTAALPVWTPDSFDQPNLMGYRETWQGDASLVAIGNTTGDVQAPSGLRFFGQGATETDSGLVTGTSVEGSQVANLVTTNETAHVAAIGYRDSVVGWQPDTHGGMVIDAQIAVNTALTTRSIFMGFIGTAAAALDPPVTGSSTTITLVQDDLCGVLMDSGLTDADGLFAAHNKSNAAATQATTDTGIDLSTTLVADTYQRFRVEISADGDARFLVDGALVGSKIAIALDIDEEVTPVLLVRSLASATKSIDIKQVSMWTSRGLL